MQKTIFTIGYEGVTVDALVRTLREAGVKILLDVRAVPLSRKPGFSKHKLAARLAEDGIGYLGLKALGTPAAGRDAARKGRIGEMRRIFADHLETDEAQDAFAEALMVAQKSPACLLCFEHAAGCCHRAVIAERLQALAGFKIIDLDPLV